MKTPLPFLAGFLALTFHFTTPLRAADQSIDMQRARELYQRSQAGEKLTDDEQKYLDEAKRQRDAPGGNAPAPDREKLRALKEKMDRGEKLTDDEQRFLDDIRSRMSGGRPPGSEPDPAMREKLRAIKEKMDRGEPFTEDEKRVADEMRRRMAPPGDARPGEFNWDRAKAAHEKEQRGETLNDDEKKLLAEARKRFEEGRGPDQPQGASQRPQNPPGDKPQAKDDFDWQKARAAHEKEKRGETLTSDEKTLLDEAKKRMSEGRGPNRRDGARNEQRPALAPPPKDLVPLTELTAKYKDQDGGLYGGGKNEPPAAHAALAKKAIAEIKPLDRDGKPASDGKVVLMSIGMSNTTQEFSTFVRLANADPRKAAHVVVVDAAQGGRDAPAWAKADAQTWQVAEQRMQAAGVSPAQVQALWIKQAIAGPHAGFPSETERLRDLERDIVTIAKKKFPNLRVAYLSSRIYAGYATGALNPEPYAYESAFAVRWLIEEQTKGAPALNADAAKGEVKAPVLLWGPYLWTNGEAGRKSDGLVFKREDLGPDGTHPSPSGREKVAKLLLDFFTTNELAKAWFTK
jgi:uncharacterized coiled-coil DUF342 family protein